MKDVGGAVLAGAVLAGSSPPYLECFFCFSSFFPTANLTATSTQREERDGKQVVFGRWLRRGRVYA